MYEHTSNQAIDAMIDTHTLPPELKDEIVHFSITGYATEHFRKQQVWGMFGRKHIKPSEIVISYNRKYTSALTHLNDADEKTALKIYQKIVQYMETEVGTTEQQDRRLREVMVILNKSSTNNMLDEVFCQLIKQTTENPNLSSLERGWELIYAVTLCVTPSNALMRVLVGHADPLRSLSTPLGGLALAVHSTLCHHLKSHKLHEVDPISLLGFSEVSYAEHIESARYFYIPTTVIIFIFYKLFLIF